MFRKLTRWISTGFTLPATTNQQNFFEILKLAPKEERAAMIVNTKVKLRFKLSGKHHETISSFADLLPQQDQATFLHSIIPDNSDILMTLVQALPVKERLHYAMTYIGLVEYGFDLGIILRSLISDDDKLALIAHVNKTTTSESLKDYVKTFIAALPEAGKRAFMMMQGKAGDTSTQKHLSAIGLFGTSID